METKKSNFESLEDREALELVDSIKRAYEQEKKLLTDNAFVYYCLWLSANNTHSLQTQSSRVKAFPFPDCKN